MDDLIQKGKVESAAMQQQKPAGQVVPAVARNTCMPESKNRRSKFVIRKGNNKGNGDGEWKVERLRQSRRWRNR